MAFNELWKLYWKRASRAWQACDPARHHSLEDALAAVYRDEHACFCG